jgi:outer membrane protein TolC
MSPLARTAARLLFRSLVLALWLAAVPALAQTGVVARTLATAVQPAAPSVVLTLDDAVRLAEERSEQIAIAQFGVARATADQQRARSERLPQVSASASYDRTLKSEFSGIFSGSAEPACDAFSLNPSRPLDARVSEIERAIDCGAVGGGGFGGTDFSNLPFGQSNTFRLNVTFSQALYAGGRIDAQTRIATVGRTLADQGVASARAQLVLDATRAFYDAALADQLVSIAEATLRQADATLAQVELTHQAGRVAEFELLRARVARDNQKPALIRARAGRTLAYLRLKQLLEIPLTDEVSVQADLDDTALGPPGRFATALAAVASAPAAETADARVPVQQASSVVALREESLRVVRAQRLPAVYASSAFGKVAYSAMPGIDDWRTNWTVGAVVQIPLFTGGRIKAEEISAGASIGEARAQQKLALELAQAETESALALLDAARANWEASAGIVEQARRAYEIAELRYREGISTQLELLDARLLLQTAQVNRAQAARDVQVARAQVALLPALPLGAASNGQSGGRSSS